MSIDLKQLEGHLTSRSYVEGYVPSQADVHVFETLKSAPSASEYPHVARWYTHIKSWESEHKTLAGSSDAGKVFSSGAAKAAEPAAADEEEEIDLFGDDDEEEEEDPEVAKKHAERVAAYNAKKAGKVKPAAKSIVTLDVKPWDDETDLAALEKSVRSIEKDGLVWGASTFVAIGYGIKKLQITVVIEDEKISLDELQEELAEFEDYVQSSDIAAMQKL